MNTLAAAVAAPPAPVRERTTGIVPVTVVIPCYNEAEGIHVTCEKLRAARERFASRYDLRFLFVDDCSRDNTIDRITQSTLSDDPFTILQHRENEGITGAILTGLREADTELVCSLDADCTYDPDTLGDLLDRMSDDVSLVTASPYHPQGHVANVPAWRLGISRGCSFLYRRLLATRLYTYTSCFRVYRRSALLDWKPKSTGFIGLVEMIVMLEAHGGRIEECPATLSVRQFGQSKMRIARVILQHLQLMGRVGWQRLSRRSPQV